MLVKQNTLHRRFNVINSSYCPGDRSDPSETQYNELRTNNIDGPESKEGAPDFQSSLPDISFCNTFFNEDDHSSTVNPFAEDSVDAAPLSSTSDGMFESFLNDILSSKDSRTTNANATSSSSTIMSSTKSKPTTTKAKKKGASKATSAQPIKKKKRVVSATYKFRPYQEEKWKERFEDLLAFRRENSHCLVPHTFPENPTLARWVKRQRYQYKLFQQKEPSSMTQERIDLLDGVGFVWHSHEVVWQERLSELMEYKKEHGDCLVPSNYTPNPKLATWVKCQRRQYKLHLRGSPSNITVERIHILEKAGFEWELRSSSYSIKNQIAAHQQKVKALKNELILPPPTVQSSVLNADLSCEGNDDDEDPMAFLKNDEEQGTSSDEPLDLLMDVLNDLPEDLSDEEMIVDASTVF
mmetsp:Transcript_8613/g.13276  ORF Transcript_8613/g.13276 Transcript_8613/m.13276 type:complete len:410 (-) Transcript_8613:132-1361(-)